MQLSDRYYIKRLKEFGLSARTTFFAGGRQIVTDTSRQQNPNVENAIKVEKEYLRGGKSMLCLHKFDPRVKYTFKDAATVDNCPNCGARIDPGSPCCPYCGSAFSMDYESKDLGTKYHTDLVMNSSAYKYISLAVSAIAAFAISYFYIKATSRTFYAWDMGKVAIGTLLLTMALYYVFYYIDCVMVILPVKLYKQKINSLQTKFWQEQQSSISKATFFTNLNYELQRFYFERPENRGVVDFDFVDYTTIEKSGDSRVRISILLREIVMSGGKLKVCQKSRDITLERVERQYSLEIGKAVIRCRGCGASIDPLGKQCPHCGTRQSYLQEWYMADN